MPPFKDRHPKVGGRKKGTKNKVPTSVKAALTQFLAAEGDLVMAALRRGLEAKPPASAAYVNLALKYGAGEPTGTFIMDREKGERGLQILLTRPIGTDPMADETSPCLPAKVAREPGPDALDRVAAALTAKKPKPQPQRSPPAGPRLVEIDGEEMEIV